MHRKDINDTGYFILPYLLFLSGQNHSQTPTLLPPTHTYSLISLGELLLPHRPYPCYSGGASNSTFIFISHGNYSRVQADISNKAVQIPYPRFYILNLRKMFLSLL